MNNFVDAFIGNNKENVVVNPDGKTFKTLSTGSVISLILMDREY